MLPTSAASSPPLPSPAPSSSPSEVFSITTSSTFSKFNKEEEEEEEDICQPFVVSLNALILDHNPEIVLKMLTVFHKLINRLPASHRFYSLLVNVLHSENAVVLANLVGKVGGMLEAMLGQQHSDASYVSGGHLLEDDDGS